eukprot:scaffold19915_cov52-Phaeocystis_antarctica.AAC.2
MPGRRLVWYMHVHPDAATATPAATPHSAKRHDTGVVFSLRRRMESRCPTSTSRSQASPARLKGSGSKMPTPPPRGSGTLSFREDT